MRCEAQTKAGKQCKNTSKTGSRCYQHQTQLEEAEGLNSKINKEDLRSLFCDQLSHVNSILKFKYKLRLPQFPEYISENMISHILHKQGIITDWVKKKRGDLVTSSKEQIECKCFSSTGPISFSPTAKWSQLYILDAQEWRNNFFCLYLIDCDDVEFKNSVMVNEDEFMIDQCADIRRPRITWEKLSPQIEYQIVVKGTFEDLIG